MARRLEQSKELYLKLFAKNTGAIQDLIGTTTMRLERFFTKLEQTHARNFLKETVEHALLANPKPFLGISPQHLSVQKPIRY